jgi:hypothetical protein
LPHSAVDSAQATAPTFRRAAPLRCQAGRRRVRPSRRAAPLHAAPPCRAESAPTVRRPRRVRAARRLPLEDSALEDSAPSPRRADRESAIVARSAPPLRRGRVPHFAPRRPRRAAPAWRTVSSTRLNLSAHLPTFQPGAGQVGCFRRWVAHDGVRMSGGGWLGTQQLSNSKKRDLEVGGVDGRGWGCGAKPLIFGAELNVASCSRLSIAAGMRKVLGCGGRG